MTYTQPQGIWRVWIVSALGIVVLLGLASPPHNVMRPLNGVDLKVPQEISGKSLFIDRFAGTLITKTTDDYDKLTFIATGTEEDLKKLEILSNQEGEVRISLHEPAGKEHVAITLTITMPKQMPLDLELVYGHANLADHTGPVKMYVGGSGVITAGTLGGELDATINGTGDITIANIDSATRTTALRPLKLAIRGSGNIAISALNYEDIKATIDGTGLIVLNGAVRDGDCTINGMGRIEIAKVTGALNQNINGSGAVVITGKQH